MQGYIPGAGAEIIVRLGVMSWFSDVGLLHKWWISFLVCDGLSSITLH